MEKAREWSLNIRSNILINDVNKFLDSNNITEEIAYNACYVIVGLVSQDSTQVSARANHTNI